MVPQPSTMPEAKFRTVKKRETDMRSIRTSEFAAELRQREPLASPATAQAQAAPPVADSQEPAAVAVVAAKAESKPEKKSKKEEKAGFSFVYLWPVAVGLFLSGFAPEWQAIATQAGIWVLRFTFPFALLAAHRDIGIHPQMVTVLPQMAVYAQLPIDGVLLMLSLLRSKSLMTAIIHVTAIHALCTFVLWLIQTGVK
jgi:hypothetical protein